jgi:hypothetical protein
VLVAAGVLAAIGLGMLLAPATVARFAHAVRISVPAPDRDGRVVLATRASGLIFFGLAIALAATSAWR